MMKSLGTKLPTMLYSIAVGMTAGIGLPIAARWNARQSAAPDTPTGAVKTMVGIQNLAEATAHLDRLSLTERISLVNSLPGARLEMSQALSNGLTNPDVIVRSDTLTMIALLRLDGAGSAVCAHLGDDYPQVSWRDQNHDRPAANPPAFDALAAIGFSTIEPLISKLATTDDDRARKLIVQAIGAPIHENKALLQYVISRRIGLERDPVALRRLGAGLTFVNDNYGSHSRA